MRLHYVAYFTVASAGNILKRSLNVDVDILTVRLLPLSTDFTGPLLPLSGHRETVHAANRV